MSFNMFDMEFSDLDPLMSADDVTEADFLDLGDSLVGDNMQEVQSFRDLHDDPQQLTLLIKSTSQEDDYEQAASFSDFQPLPKSFNKKKTSQSRNNSKVIHRPASRNAARERSRVKSLRCAFLDLQNSLPSVPPNTKLSKLDVLVLATTYIAHLMKVLDKPGDMTAVTDNVNSQHLYHSTSSNNNYNDIYIGNYANKFPGTQTLMSKPLSNNKRSDKNTDSHHRLHEKGYLHPVRKWPMRSRLYAGAIEEKSGSQFQLPTYISALNNDYLKFDNL